MIDASAGNKPGNVRTRDSICKETQIHLPSGHYTLNLADPAERSIALQLCQLNRQPVNHLMKNTKLNGAVIPPAKYKNWPEKCMFVQAMFL